MGLSASALSSLVYKDLLSAFPTAVASNRSNIATGVPTHNVPEAFISAYCEGFVNAVLTLTIMDLGSGTLPTGGVPAPATFSFVGISTADAYLISRQAWTGTSAAQAAMIFIDSVLLNTAALGQLLMNTNPGLGTGTGVVSAASNPALEAAALGALTPAMQASFLASGKFGEGDVPSAPVNAILLAQLPGYCEALAKGIATITAQVAYVSGATPLAAVSAIPNTGKIL